MTKPAAEQPIDFAIICRTCLVTVWQGNTPQGDGQVVLTAYADSVPGTVCPSKVDPCPNRAAALAARPVPVTAADLVDVKKRLDKIEAKVKP
jgi:hypothetical protein